MDPQTLILTPWMAPHRIVPWQIAMVDICNSKIVVLEEYDEVLCEHAGSTIMMPAVARLTKPVGHVKKGVKFSRINVMTRDDFTCCYCGCRKPMRDLNYDHVIPRRLGGRTIWENIVTSCYDCNSRKAGRTPEQAGMRLRPPRSWAGHGTPYVPKTLPMNRPMLRSDGVVPELWAPYLEAHGTLAVG